MAAPHNGTSPRAEHSAPGPTFRLQANFPPDPFNLGRIYWGVQNFNHNLVYNLSVAYLPPVFQGQQGLLEGRTFAPIFRAGTGAPIECNMLTSNSQFYGAGDGVNFFGNENCVFVTAAATARSCMTTNADGTHSV
jgi:hypothetical protein